jgi:hypothetical protein
MAKREQLMEMSKEELVKIIEEKESEIKDLNGMMRNVMEYNIRLEDKLPKDQKSGKVMFYKQQWAYVDKLVYILKLAGRPMQSSDILECLLKHDKNANYWRDSVKSLSVHLNKALKYKKILFYKEPGMNGYYYTLPEWTDERKLKS